MQWPLPESYFKAFDALVHWSMAVSGRLRACFLQERVTGLCTTLLILVDSAEKFTRCPECIYHMAFIKPWMLDPLCNLHLFLKKKLHLRNSNYSSHPHFVHLLGEFEDNLPQEKMIWLIERMYNLF